MVPNDRSDNLQPAASADANQVEGAASNPEVRNRGQIAEMILPEGWVEAPPVQFSGGIGMKSRRVIHPPEAPRVRLCFFYRGLPMSQDAAKNFLNVLQGPPHSVETEEWESLSVLLRDRNDPEEFTFSSAYTVDWNDRRVLVVEGRYREIEEDNFEIFIDALGDGRVVQEVFFQAPIALYRSYLSSAMISLKSIRWNPLGANAQPIEVDRPLDDPGQVIEKMTTGSIALDSEQEAQLRRDLAAIAKLPAATRQRIFKSLLDIVTVSPPSDSLQARERADVATALAHQIAYPSSIRPGFDGTSIAANIEKILATQHAEQYANMMAQLALRREYIAPDGETIVVIQIDRDRAFTTDRVDERKRSPASDLAQAAIMQLSIPQGWHYECHKPGYRPAPEETSPAQDSGNRWLKEDGSAASGLGLKPGAEERILNMLAPDYRYESRTVETPEDLGKAWVDNGGNSPMQVCARVEAPKVDQSGKPAADTHAVNITHIDFDVAGNPTNVYF